MAAEIAVSATLAYQNTAKNISQKLMDVAPTSFDITGASSALCEQLIPTTAGGTAIDVSNLATLGWHMIRNLDTANYVDILTAASGTVIDRIPAGGVKLGYFPPNITAPAALAHTAAVRIQFLILEI